MEREFLNKKKENNSCVNFSFFENILYKQKKEFHYTMQKFLLQDQNSEKVSEGF